MVLDLSRQHQKLLEDIFRAHTPNVEVWAYGSRTNGQGHTGSDLDLVLRDPATPLRPLEGLGRLRDAISESNIPFLVDLHD